MAARLRSDLDARVEMIRSSGGVFEVVADGDLVYSKRTTGTFPDEARLVAELASRDRK